MTSTSSSRLYGKSSMLFSGATPQPASARLSDWSTSHGTEWPSPGRPVPPCRWVVPAEGRAWLGEVVAVAGVAAAGGEQVEPLVV